MTTTLRDDMAILVQKAEWLVKGAPNKQAHDDATDVLDAIRKYAQLQLDHAQATDHISTLQARGGALLKENRNLKGIVDA